MLKLAYQYMRYYKSQTFAIFASIFLTAALMSGIGSLMYSSRKNDVENSRRIYGDWHYCIETGIDTETKTFPVSGTDTANGIKGEGFRLERYAKAKVTGELSELYQIRFLHVDEFYRRMLCREITEGREPNAANEIAADSYTLVNLGFGGGVGDALKLGGKSYILTGLVKSKWNSGADEMEVFVGKGTGQTKIYLRFDENEKLYKQMEAFQERYNIPGDAVETNDSLTMYLGGERPDSIYDIIYAMAALLGMFSLFVIYSVFNISVSKRKAEYAVLQTLGVGETAICVSAINGLEAYLPIRP